MYRVPFETHGSTPSPALPRYLRLYSSNYPCCHQGRVSRCYGYHPISELNPLPEHIENGIPNAPSAKVETLHHCAAQDSTTEEDYSLRLSTWRSTLRNAYVKVEARCSIACYSGTNQWCQENTPGCPNVSSMILRAQRGYSARNKEYEKEAESERQRFNTAGRWAPSKGTDLVDNDDDVDGKSGRKSGS